MKNVKSSWRHLSASCEFYMNRTDCQTLVLDLLSTRLKNCPQNLRKFAFSLCKFSHNLSLSEIVVSENVVVDASQMKGFSRAD